MPSGPKVVIELPFEGRKVKEAGNIEEGREFYFFSDIFQCSTKVDPHTSLPYQRRVSSVSVTSAYMHTCVKSVTFKMTVF